MPVKPYNDFTGGLDLNQSTTIPDKCFTIAKNVFYNNAKQLQSRRGFTTFGNNIGNSPITSYFFYQRDDNQQRIAIAFSGDSMYSYTEGTATRTLVTNGLHEYETIPGRTTERTRWDFAVYKNSVYMCNGVDPYCAYDGTNYGRIDMGTPTVFTFVNATDLLHSVAHGLTNGDEVLLTTTGTFPSGVTAGQVYYVVNKTVDDFQIASSKNGTVITFTTDGTGVQSFSKLGQPRVRYIQYLGDRLYGAGDDGNPISLYYTAAAPVDGNTLNANVVVVGGDENGIINGLNEYNQLVLTFKSGKVYTVNIATPSVEAIDAQTGGYADRTIQVVGNQLLYFNERGIDSLNKRYGVDGTGAIESKPLSENIRELTKDITEKQYNSATSWYIKPINNYYFSFDTNGDNIPDTTTVLNSTVTARTQYNYPNLYDYGYYINSDGVVQFLIASAITGQMYQIEYGFTDNGEDIDREIQTKDFDFDDPAQQKISDFVEVTGYKALGNSIPITILGDGMVVSESFVTDAMLNQDITSGPLGVDPIGIYPLGVGANDSDELQLYLYSIKVPYYTRCATLTVNMTGNVQHILEKMKISVNGEPNDLFPYANIG